MSADYKHCCLEERKSEEIMHITLLQFLTCLSNLESLSYVQYVITAAVGKSFSRFGIHLISERNKPHVSAEHQCHRTVFFLYQDKQVL